MSLVNYEILQLTTFFNLKSFPKHFQGSAVHSFFVNYCISKCHQQAFNQHATSATHFPSNSLIHLEIEVQRPRNRRGIPNLNAPRRPPHSAEKTNEMKERHLDYHIFLVMCVAVCFLYADYCCHLHVELVVVCCNPESPCLPGTIVLVDDLKWLVTMDAYEWLGITWGRLLSKEPK